MMHNATPMLSLQRNVPLAPLTTIGIGGPAKYFVFAENVDDITEAIAWADANSERLFVMSGGSNLLIDDEGFDGLVLQVRLRGVTVESEDADSVIVKVGAGERWDDLVATAVENRWAGLECLSGIPGSAGATPIQNVGAYGQDVSETIIHVEVVDRESRRVITLTNAECGFSYRSSIFKSDARDRYVVASVTFRLRRNGAATVKYPELLRYLEERGESLDDLANVRAAVIAIRKRKGMVLDPNDPDTRSDGSFFMNPLISRATFDELAARAGDMPNFPAGDDVKLSAAWLIERAGFQKGFAHGNVGLSSKHTLAVINRGGGTAREVKELVAIIQGGVRAKFGVEIHPEPIFVGVGK
jgi:UDP-N-acetylmuramate dehydrogenase